MHLNRRRFVVAAMVAACVSTAPCLLAQMEGPQRSHAVVRVEGDKPVTAERIQLRVDRKDVQLKSWRPLVQGNVPVELVVALDDGMRDFGNNLDSIRQFLASLPPNVAVGVGYMRNGRIMMDGDFRNSRDAERSVRVPMGSPGASGSPYFCISDIAKHWPSQKRAVRMVLMVTNGIDLYNGRPTVTNQNSPYVDTAISDAQRAGITVYSIFWSSRNGGAGLGYGGFSGESYLSDLSESTGGDILSHGTLNPPSIDAFLKDFVKDLQRSYLASFDAQPNKGHLVELKVSAHNAKVRAARQIRAGN